jgi:NADPH:quinone reductase-like Zn-dependent oxidoreductase
MRAVVHDRHGLPDVLRLEEVEPPGPRADEVASRIFVVWTARLAASKVVFPVPPRHARQDVDFLRLLIEAGEYRPVIARCYLLEQVVEATRYVETQQKTGNVVLTIGAGHR